MTEFHQLNLAYTGFVVSDLSKFERFWCDGMRFRRAWVSTLSADKVRELFNINTTVQVMRYVRGNTVIEAYLFLPSQETATDTLPKAGKSHIGFIVRDREGFIREIIAKIGEIPVHRFPNDSGIVGIYIQDFEGNVVELLPEIL